MKFEPDLIPVTLKKRYKRFLADILLDDGQEITVHCPNTGSMKNCVVPDSKAWISDSNNPKRKYRHTWEVATSPTGHLIGVNTHRANKLVVEGVQRGIIRELQGYSQLATEQKYGDENSRIDIVLQNDQTRCFVEVKSVTLEDQNGLGLFPDAVSERASKHVRELIAVKQKGDRAVLCFCVQHTGIESVSPADEIDPKYGQLLRQAAELGVEILAYRAAINTEEIKLTTAIPVVLD